MNIFIMQREDNIFFGGGER